MVNKYVTCQTHTIEHMASIVHLTSNQLDLINKAIPILSPFEEITKSISTDQSSPSLIAPFIRGFQNKGDMEVYEKQ